MNNKKAQAQIITVVLIILLVLAAIIIVWQVIRGTVGDTTEELESRSDCIGADIEIASAPVGGPVSVKRNVGGPDGDIDITVIRNGAPVVNAITDLGQLETDSYTVALVAGDTIEIAAEIGAVQCAAMDSTTVVA